MAKLTFLLCAVIAFALFAVACGDDDSDDKQQSGQSADTSSGQTNATAQDTSRASGTVPPGSGTAQSATAATPAPGTPVAVGTVGVAVQNGEVSSGSELKVPVTISSPSGQKLGSWIVDVTFDPALLSVSACSGEGTSVCNPSYRPDTLRLVGVSVEGLEGQIGSITFKGSGSKGAKSAIRVAATNCTTQTSQPVTCEGATSEITIK
ncbi:hypothetical protein AYO38_07135 [bacterium SCGC AG-212-C10]|nr:hypothetical protein AYO38_07135 [bacterium SCGC AG-212-C10]